VEESAGLHAVPGWPRAPARRVDQGLNVMLRIIANRLVVAVPTLILVSMLIFGLQKLLPGDPVRAMAGEDQDPQVIATLRAKYHLDEPVPTQYVLWVKDMLHGNLGVSLRTDVPVTSL